MDLTQPMILANAMIFHNQFSQQMTQQLNSSTILYQPSFHHQNHPINVNPCYYRENSIIVEPIKETINTPMILEDLISDKIIFKGVLGILKEKEEHFLIVSAFLNLPNSHQCRMIKKIIEDKIQQHC